MAPLAYAFVLITFLLIFTAVQEHFLIAGAKNPATKTGREKLAENQTFDISRLELSFVRNKGQLPAPFEFSSRAAGQDLFFTNGQVIFNLRSVAPKDRPEISAEKEPSEERQNGKSEIDLPDYVYQTVGLNIINAKKDHRIVGEAEKTGKVNIFKGDDPSGWHTDLSTYGRIRYVEVYPGTDLIFYGNEGRLQYDFIVAPGADPGRIGFSFTGVEDIKKDAAGNLVLAVGKEELSLSRPYIYQLGAKGKQKLITGAFRINEDRSVGFEIGEYDRTKTLIIDPILSYSSFLGGTFDEIGNGIATDQQGNIYITGLTRSIDFPITAGGGRNFSASDDVFVTKLNPQGTDFIYSTVIGSSQDDVGNDIKVDSAGRAYVVGDAGDFRFPQQNALPYGSTIFSTTPQVDNWENKRGINIAVNQIVPSPSDPLTAFAATRGGIYKTTDGGNTWLSKNKGFGTFLLIATAIGIHPTDPSIVFAAGLRHNGNVPNPERLFKSTDGGENWQIVEHPFGQGDIHFITIDPNEPQNIYFSVGGKVFKSADGGNTWNESNTGMDVVRINDIVPDPRDSSILYAVTSGGIYRSTNGGGAWAAHYPGEPTFSLAFDPVDPSIFYYSTFAKLYKSTLNGTARTLLTNDLPFAVMNSLVINPANVLEMYAGLRYNGIWQSTDGGATWSQFANGIPTQNVQAVAITSDGQKLLSGTDFIGGAGSGFVLKLNAAGNDFIYSTFFGDVNTSVALDANGRAYVGGYASYDAIPQVNSLAAYNRRDDGYVAIIDTDGEALLFSSYLGGAEDEEVYDVALDAAGNIYLTGRTWSADFPTVNPLQPNRIGQFDAFITKLSPNGAGYVYSSYFGGSEGEFGNAVVADAQGNAYITGSTASSDLPTGAAPALQSYTGQQDVYIAKFDPSGTNLLYSTYLGGGTVDIAHDILIDQTGRIVVAGQSESVDFPIKRSPKSKSPMTKSVDRAESWSNDVEGLAVNSVNAIAIHPQLSTTILIATDKGVYKSTDGGDSWVRKNNGINTDLIHEVVYAPSNPSIAYAGSSPNGVGTTGGVYKSTDGGENWTAVNNGITARQIHAIAVDPSNLNTVYAGSNGFDLGFPMYKSTNGGASWNIIGSSTIVNISDIEIDPTNPSTVYATSTHLIKNAFRSQDGGINWQVLGQGIPDFSRAYSIKVDPDFPTRVYLGMDGGIYRSTNRGTNWLSALPEPNIFTRLAIDPDNTLTIYAATIQGLFISTDGGINWNKKNDGLIYQSLSTIAVNPNNTGVLYAGARPHKEFDAFVAKLNPAGSALEYAALFGSLAPEGELPFSLDYIHAIALAGDGGIYSTGYTRRRDFPTTPGAFSNHFYGNLEAFLSKLNDSRQIRGRIADQSNRPVNGVMVEISGTNTKTLRTGFDGKYKTEVRQNGNYLIAPRKLGYSFNPASMTIDDLSTDAVGNFTAIPATRTISGRITDGQQNGISGVTVSLSGSREQSIDTDAAGFYSLSVPFDGSYTVTASKSGLIFSPETHQFERLTENQTADFTAAAGHKISGTVTAGGIGLSNVPVNLSGTRSATVLTDTSGSFSFSAPAGGDYTVTPVASASYTFTPPSFSVSNLSSAQNVAFAAALSEKTNGPIIFSAYEIINNVANFDIFVLSAGNRTNLTNHPAGDISPVWSPDGTKIAFSSNRDGNWEIYVMNADGTGQRRLTDNQAVDSEPAWSPDGDRVIFVSMPAGSSSAEIYTVDVSNKNLTRLTNNIWWDFSPAWSPDGNQIAFVSERDGGNAELYLMDKNGGNARRLTESVEPDSNPAWSPDGALIAFDRGEGNDREIFSIRRDGTGETQLTDNMTEDKTPAFSPDGDKIVFAGLYQCSTSSLLVMNTDGSQNEPLTNCARLDSEPDWKAAEAASRPVRFDFDGDGRTDISIFRPGPGEWWYQRSSDNGVYAAQFGATTDTITPADFTGDRATDIAFWREATGEWFVLRSEDNSFFSFPFGTQGDIPVPGDYDGDGEADPAVFRPATATWYILTSSGGTIIQQFGASGDVPVPGDFDGDGRDDLAVYRPGAAAEWYYQQSSDGQVLGLQFGTSGDRPVAADYTGDGRTDVAFWRETSGEWYILRSEDNSFFAFPFGQAGDVPVPGDYDGDGRADAAVFRPSDTTWYLMQSTASFRAVSFGINGDKPAPAAFIY